MSRWRVREAGSQRVASCPLARLSRGIKNPGARSVIPGWRSRCPSLLLFDSRAAGREQLLGGLAGRDGAGDEEDGGRRAEGRGWWVVGGGVGGREQTTAASEGRTSSTTASTTSVFGVQYRPRHPHAALFLSAVRGKNYATHASSLSRALSHTLSVYVCIPRSLDPSASPPRFPPSASLSEPLSRCSELLGRERTSRRRGRGWQAGPRYLCAMTISGGRRVASASSSAGDTRGAAPNGQQRRQHSGRVDAAGARATMR
jgi:hypothetical protein